MLRLEILMVGTRINEPDFEGIIINQDGSVVDLADLKKEIDELKKRLLAKGASAQEYEQVVVTYEKFMREHGQRPIEGTMSAAPLMDTIEQEQPSQENLDEDGIAIKAKRKTNGLTYHFDATKDPKQDKRLDLHEADDNIQLKTEGNIKYISFKAHTGGLASGGTQDTCRIHVKTESQGKQQCNYSTCAPEKHFLVGDRDIGNIECTIIARPSGKISDHGEAITAKLRGGPHAKNSNDCSCIGLIFPYSGNDKKMFEKEFIHPKYEFYQVTNQQYNNYENKWMGLKAMSFAQSDGNTKNVGWVNNNPLGTNGKPDNTGWKKIFEFVDKGNGIRYKPVASWGAERVTWRCDQAAVFDIAYMNHHEIEALE